jgi:hypothetical protein
MGLAIIQNKLERVRNAQAKLAAKEAGLLEQLKQLRAAGDPPFAFLYETGEDNELRCREYRSAHLTIAAKRMARFMDRHREWARPSVDYEVAFKGEYIDLYEAIGESHPLYEYLP